MSYPRPLLSRSLWRSAACRRMESRGLIPTPPAINTRFLEASSGCGWKKNSPPTLTATSESRMHCRGQRRAFSSLWQRPDTKRLPVVRLSVCPWRIYWFLGHLHSQLLQGREPIPLARSPGRLHVHFRDAGSTAMPDADKEARLRDSATCSLPG